MLFPTELHVQWVLMDSNHRLLGLEPSWYGLCRNTRTWRLSPLDWREGVTSSTIEPGTTRTSQLREKDLNLRSPGYEPGGHS